jgi:hypothetical protein
MINFIIYGFYNLIYQILSICFLFYANTFLNGFLIPNSFLWENHKPKENLIPAAIMQTVILIVETVLLMFLMYYINKWYLSSVAKSNNSNNIALWTAGIYSVITLSFIIFLMYVCFKQ